MFMSLFPLFVAALLSVALCHTYDYYNENDVETKAAACCPASSAEVERLFKECRNVEVERNTVEEELSREGKVIKSDRKIADMCLIRQRKQDPANRVKELKQLPFETVTIKLVEKYGLTSSEINDCLPTVEFKGKYGTRARSACLQTVFNGTCDFRSPYRTANGTCNNLRNPRWGSAGICFERLLPPRYEGVSGFRQSFVGGPLPEPRDLSLKIHSHLNNPAGYVTHMYMFFGQLLDHDITQAPFSITVNDQAIECCGVTGPLHPQCAPIAIRPRDPFYAQFGTTCINLVRSVICPTCTLGPRQQINQITAFIDASFVYGNSLNETDNLRTNDGTGRMRVLRTSVGDLLPNSPDPVTDQCSFVNTSDICFLAGDGRANQHTTLASLHTIFLREHNRLADGLRQMNPSWNDERIFQEARKIVGAEMQVITYTEYLPITLGNQRMNQFNLRLTNGERTVYNASANPSLYNEFSAAAFRFGHSLIGSIVADSPRTAGNRRRLLRDEFFQPFDLRTGVISQLMVGVTGSPAQVFDRHLVPDVTNFLYRIRGQQSGLDLASINIQRGRDHGIPTYVEMVNYCSEGKITVNSFGDLVNYKIMSEANMGLLYHNYRHVNDIDLWTGILSEDYFSDSAVAGRTAACVIATQFRDLKFGDRFYFEHGNQAGSFTYQQLQELREMSLSKIICLNTDDVIQLPLNAMIYNKRNNPFITCSNVVGVDLSYWRGV